MPPFSPPTRASYDAINKRIARFDEIQVGRHRDRDFFAIVELFESKTRFTVNLKTKECNKTSIDYEFRRFGIPSNASFAGQAEIGTDAERNTGVLVDFWFIETDDIRWEGESTSSDCLPVSDLFEDRRLGAVHTSFYDIALGISDPNVFDVPKECQ